MHAFYIVIQIYQIEILIEFMANLISKGITYVYVKMVKYE